MSDRYFPRLTSGHVGRVGFDSFNRVSDALARLGETTRDGRRRRWRKTQVAYLIIPESTVEVPGFDPDKPQYRYGIKLSLWDMTALDFVAVDDAVELPAYNIREVPSAYQSGQAMTLANGATLGWSACTGPVFAWESGRVDDDKPVMLFSEPNPSDADC